MQLIFAQALGEYGGLSALTAGIQQLTSDVTYWLGSLTTTQWIIAGIVIVGLFFLTRRR
jgi:hypothetical protein